jgi:phage head maturation protease
MAQRTPDQMMRRAAFEPSTYDESSRTVELVWSTGAKVRRSTWFDGDFHEELSLDGGAVRLDRLNSGASLLNNHQSRDLSNVIGVVERAWIADGQGRAIVRFSERADVAPIVQDVASGIIRNVSVGYKVHRWQQFAAPEGELPTFRAVDWEPFELSLVGIPADAGAQVRADSDSFDHPEPMTVNKAGGDPAALEQRDQQLEAQAPAAAPAPAAEPAPVAATAERSDELSPVELKRQNDILRSCAAAKMPELADGYIAGGLAHDQAVRDLISKMANSIPVPAAGSPARVEVTRDAGEHLVRGFGEALQFRTGAIKEPTELGRQYRGLTLLEMGRMMLERNGVNTLGMSRTELVSRAFHSTSDFPLLFADVANKNLLAGYAEEPQSWRPLARQRNLPDFKSANELQLQGQVVPETLLEGGEYKTGTMVEGRGQWNLTTYAKKLQVTRRAIINDDLSALSRGPELLGRGCRLLESNLVWALLTTGANGANVAIDGQALFVAGHNNTGSGAIGVGSVAAGRAAMRKQKDIANNSLNLAPRFLIVPSELETTAEAFLEPNAAQVVANVGDAGPNPFRGRLQMIVENRLSDDSAAMWYLAADPGRIEMIRFGYLDGEEGPNVTINQERDPDGVQMLVRMDFGCSMLDFRGFYRSTGV